MQVAVGAAIVLQSIKQERGPFLSLKYEGHVFSCTVFLCVSIGVPGGQCVFGQSSGDHQLGVQGQGQELPPHGTALSAGVLQGACQTPLQHPGQGTHTYTGWMLLAVLTVVKNLYNYIFV